MAMPEGWRDWPEEALREWERIAREARVLEAAIREASFMARTTGIPQVWESWLNRPEVRRANGEVE